MSPARSVLVAGVGGQGVLSTARLLGTAAISAGIAARVGQIYGLSQRGGSVQSTVRLDEGVTAFIAPGDAGVVVALEPLEAERALPMMAPTTTVLINRTPIVPTSLTQGRADYPALSQIVARIEAIAGEVTVIAGTELASEAGSRKYLNLVMLGLLARTGVLPFEASFLADEVARFGSPEEREARQNAFKLGYEAPAVAVNTEGPGVPTPTTKGA